MENKNNTGDSGNRNSGEKVKQTMYCVYSPWGFHRCYEMKPDADRDAKRCNQRKYDMMPHSFIECSVIECAVELTPNKNNTEL